MTDHTPTPQRSLTADFFSTPVRTPSPPPTKRKTTTAATLLAAIHPSRIFPSRYTSRPTRDYDVDQHPQYKVPDHPSPIFFELSDDTELAGSPHFSLMPSPHVHPPRALSSLSSLSTSSSSESTHSSLGIPDSSSSNQVPERLPTPPPPALLDTTQNSTTPRPAHLEPRFTTTSLPPTSTVVEKNKILQVDPIPGCIITTDPPTISLPDTTSSLNQDQNQIVTPSSSSTTNKLILIHPLGQGAFSSVWLAKDLSPIPLTLKSKKSIRESRRKASAAVSRKSSGRSISGPNTAGGPGLIPPTTETAHRTDSLRMRNLRARVKGTRPLGFNTRFLDERHGEMGTGTGTASVPSISSCGELSSLILSPPISASNSTASSTGNPESGPTDCGVLDTAVTSHDSGMKIKRRKKSRKARLVAVKLTPRPSSSTSGGKEEEEEERTRVGFVREIEILKHISHLNITVLLEHLSTPSHHILVLPYLPGGDLLGLVNSDVAWSKLGESVLRRIWCELCKAVGWMHGVGLVHRDIKLENILLTTKAFSTLTPTSPRPTLSTLPETPTPLIKLTDFGLSRFIQVDESTGEGELLWTRCGSEAYAAPELVLGTGSVRAQAQAQRRNHTRRRSSSTQEQEGMKGFYDARETDAWACGVVLYTLVGRRLPFGEGANVGGTQGRIDGDGTPGHGYGRGSALERRQWLMKIARGDYDWPTSPELSLHHSQSSSLSTQNGEGGEEEEEELVGSRLIHSNGAKRIVGKLMVRDPRRRARIIDLWEDEWMWGPGGGLAVGMTEAEWREREQIYHSSNPSEIGLGIDFGESGPPAHFVNQASVEDDTSGEGIGIEVDYANDVDDEKVFMDEGMGDLVYEEVGEVGDALEEIEGECEGEVEEVLDGEEGWLLDQEGIGSVARQELV